LRDGVLRDGVLRDGVLRDGVLRDGVLRDGVLRDGVLRDGVLRDGVLRDGVLRWGEHALSVCSNCRFVKAFAQSGRTNFRLALIRPGLVDRVATTEDNVLQTQHTTTIQGAKNMPVNMLIKNADLVATVNDAADEWANGWVTIENRRITGVGPKGSEPLVKADTLVIEAQGCLVTPGLINTHHHIYQNLTRAYGPAVNGTLFEWLTVLYPLWSRLDEEAAYLSAWIGLAELALGGCTTSTDHLYVHPRGGGDLITAEISAAKELGFRFHPTRGSMSLSKKDGGLPPDSVVQTDEEILIDSERLVKLHHDANFGAMVRVALAPCSPFSVTPALMAATAELAERLDVRLHTHLAEDHDEDVYCLEHFGRRPVEQFEHVGWGSNRSWVAHCIFPNEVEIARLGAWGTGVAHCPSSNMILGNARIAPIQQMRAAGVPVGLGCDGSSSNDAASLWQESRNAMLLGRTLNGSSSFSARDALHIATRGGAGCLGREGEIGQLTVGSVADVVVWPIDGIRFAGAISDPIEAWLRCGPVSAKHTIINGEFVVRNGDLVAPGVEEKLRDHKRVAERMQA
jgi:cytosine/adenosine deaminase-related metal-dependent hydrolase